MLNSGSTKGVSCVSEARMTPTQGFDSQGQRKLLDEVYQLLQASELTRHIDREHVLLRPVFPVLIHNQVERTLETAAARDVTSSFV